MLIELSSLIILTIIIPQKCFSLISFHNNACKNLNSYPFKAFSQQCYYDPDTQSSTPNIISRHGYNVETHTVSTEDGYILTLFRIPAAETNNLGPVFLQHGILASSSMWLIMGSNSIPLKLADLGYDVWLGNLRGSEYSPEHISLAYKDKKFWNYNLDTMAANDIVTELLYVAEKVGTQLIYIGHSMGTTLLFMLGSEQPDLVGQLVKAFIAIAPVAYVRPTFLYDSLSKSAPEMKFILNIIDVYGFQFDQAFRNELSSTCIKVPYFCLSVLATLGGKFSGQFPNERLLNAYDKFPDAISVDSLIQYSQILKTREFKHFDYGSKKNQEIYNSDSPPFYDLANFVVPTIMFYGENDNIVSQKEATRTFNELGSTEKTIIRIPSGNNRVGYNHFMFLFSKDIQFSFLPRLIGAIEQLNVQVNDEVTT